MGAGRPTKYDQDVLEKAQAYAFEYEKFEDEIPSTAGLARMLGVAKSTVCKWANEIDEFSDALETIQSEQERVLLSKGLNSKFNSTITKLMLTNHGYSDKQQVQHANNPENPLDFTVNFVRPDHAD